ncbi:MAG: hypothetical protein ACKOGE_04450 [Actinomycetota bacterium]
MSDRVVAVFGSSRIGPDDPEYAVAQRLGRLLGHPARVLVPRG